VKISVCTKRKESGAQLLEKEEPHIIRLCLQMMCRDISRTGCNLNIKTGHPVMNCLRELLW